MREFSGFGRVNGTSAPPSSKSQNSPARTTADEQSAKARSWLTMALPRRLPSLGADALAVLQTSLFEYFSREFVHGSAENGVACT